MTLYEKIKKEIDKRITTTEFVRGIKCRKCGHMDIPPFYHNCCQSCGAYIVTGYNKHGGWTINANADIITIKKTTKLSTTFLEEM